MEDCEASLRNIFLYYVSYGDPLNIDKLKPSKLIKMYTDAGLIKEPVGSSGKKQ